MIAIAAQAPYPLLWWWPDPLIHPFHPLFFLFVCVFKMCCYRGSTRVRANTPTFFFMLCYYGPTQPVSVQGRERKTEREICRERTLFAVRVLDAPPFTFPLPPYSAFVYMSIYAKHLKWPGHMDFPPLLLIICYCPLVLFPLSLYCNLLLLSLHKNPCPHDHRQRRRRLFFCPPHPNKRLNLI